VSFFLRVKTENAGDILAFDVCVREFFQKNDLSGMKREFLTYGPGRHNRAQKIS
jgi:hypothetical protein